MSAINTDARLIDFSQPTVLGLSNPLRLTGLNNSWQVSILSQITNSPEVMHDCTSGGR